MALACLPLPATSLAIATLVVGPALGLFYFPRPQALGLERLLSQVALLQSFPAQARRPLPALWQQRLGPAVASQAWSRPGLWWQFWSEHGDDQPYLALPWAALPTEAKRRPPAHSLRVDDLLVVAPDRLSERLLSEQLKTKQRASRGLELRCGRRLQQEQAVYWSPAGLGGLLGPMAPLLQRFQEGCLSLQVQGEQLVFSGESTATPGLLGDGLRGASPRSEADPLGPDRLLEIRGPALNNLFQGLLARQLVREPLATRYGIGDGPLSVVRKVPFLLRLSPVSKGPFQASLDIQLPVGNDRRAWAEILQGLRQPLLNQGFSEGPPALSPPASAIRSSVLPSALWSSAGGQLLGGWRWIREPSRPPVLLIFLGPEPSLSQGDHSRLSILPGRDSPLQLRLRPQALNALKLLPPDLPNAVKQARQLAISATGDPSQALSQLSGRLQWDRAR